MRADQLAQIDLASHERGYPVLEQITQQLVGAAVLTPQATAGDLWLTDGTRRELAEVVIPNNNLTRLQPRLIAHLPEGGPGHDRQVRLFGDSGQATLHRLHVAVVALGGVGGLIVETLSRLGVGQIQAVTRLIIPGRPACGATA